MTRGLWVELARLVTGRVLTYFSLNLQWVKLLPGTRCCLFGLHRKRKLGRHILQFRFAYLQMVTFCAIIMLSKPFANLSSNNSAFNDEVSTVADGRVSSEGCCRPTRVMSVTKAIWLQKPKSVEVTLVIAPLE